jgi:hypothetical protein
MKNIQLLVNPKDDPVKVAAFISTLTQNLRVSRAAQAGGGREMGPFETEWCKVAHKTRVRTTGGRTPEAQAKHNLKTYRDYSTAQLKALEA